MRSIAYAAYYGICMQLFAKLPHARIWRMYVVTELVEWKIERGKLSTSSLHSRSICSVNDPRSRCGMPTSIIYQNGCGTITLLDLPTSIENGQYLCCNGHPQRLQSMLSTAPPNQPYATVEPRGWKRAQLLDRIPQAEQDYHNNIQALIADSLREIRAGLGDPQWLLPRQNALPFLNQTLPVSPQAAPNDTSRETPLILSPMSNVFSSVEDVANRIVSNPFSQSTNLVLGCISYHIPPLSTFILSEVERLCPVPTTIFSPVFPASFDFILMDPPWQNRSVRHSKTYQTSKGRNEDTFLCVLPIVQSHLRANGLVGIWLTNKASIRRTVLDSLRQRGFHLYEEWVWMKTTTKGEPVTPLDGLWRRPYEVLLLFRREQSHKCSVAAALEKPDCSIWASKVPCRIFVAVPSHHSQKPCLKEFIEPLLPDSTNYHALEVFARNLTAGWFCWGNEVLKYNAEDHWDDH
jgi:N6-adenosine-specific RNA methylase IME4